MELGPCIAINYSGLQFSGNFADVTPLWDFVSLYGRVGSLLSYARPECIVTSKAPQLIAVRVTLDQIPQHDGSNSFICGIVLSSSPSA